MTMRPKPQKPLQAQDGENVLDIDELGWVLDEAVEDLQHGADGATAMVTSAAAHGLVPAGPDGSAGLMKAEPATRAGLSGG